MKNKKLSPCFAPRVVTGYKGTLCGTLQKHIPKKGKRRPAQLARKNRRKKPVFLRAFLCAQKYK